MKKHNCEKLLVKLAEIEMRRSVSIGCQWILYQPKISDEMKEKLQRFKKK